MDAANPGSLSLLHPYIVVNAATKTKLQYSHAFIFGIFNFVRHFQPATPPNIKVQNARLRMQAISNCAFLDRAKSACGRILDHGKLIILKRHFV